MKTLVGLLFASALFAQTNTGGLTPKGAVNAGGATSTIPSKAGTSLPTTCTAGETYFKTDNPAGQAWYLCAPANVWTQTTSPSITPTPGFSPSQPLGGCGVEYVSGLTFNIGACQYTINGVVYNSPITSKTLTTASGSFPRIDVIGVDTSNTVFVVDGTAAASPQQPTLDPATQLGLTFIYVATSATTPTGPSVVSIYEENTEWTSAVTANVNAASTSNPYRGSKDVEYTAAVLTNNVTLTKPAAGTEIPGSYSNLIFYIRSKATWPSGNGSGANAARQLSIYWRSGSTQVGQAVLLKDGQFGFSSAIISVYQQVSIPMSLFGTGSATATNVRFEVTGNGGSSAIGFYLDGISLQGGASSFVPTSPRKATLLFNGGSSVASTGRLGLNPGNGPVTGSISRVDVTGEGAAGAACTATADIWKRNAAIPTLTQKISAAAPATLSSGNLVQSMDISTWINKQVAANDVWSATLATNTDCVNFMVEIYY